MDVVGPRDARYCERLQQQRNAGAHRLHGAMRKNKVSVGQPLPTDVDTPLLTRKFFSFGISCQPAFQIRRATGTSIAYFFDWLITPLASIEHVLQKFEPKRFLAEGVHPCDSGLRVLDKYSGVRLQHDFQSHAGHIVLKHVGDLIPLVREKYTRRRQRLVDAMAAEPSVLIRYEWGTSDFGMSEVQVMHTFRSSCRAASSVKHLFVLASEHVSRTRFVADCLYFRLDPFDGDSADHWKGDNASWDRLFKMANDRVAKHATRPSPDLACAPSRA